MVSKEYSPGIMTNPVRLMTDNDMMDMDWNASWEDAVSVHQKIRNGKELTNGR